MRNALKIGTIAGIGIYLHWTFGLLVAGIFAFYLIQGSTVAAALVGVGLILAVFACVVLHELGHALTARRYGVPTRDITLYPIGGVARLQRIPEEPMKEFWIAVAGPAVNVAIAAVLYVVMLAVGEPFSFQALMDPEGTNMLALLLWLNLILVGFNLLPAFPMDGGRVLRALLATRMPYARATQIAATIGQGMAILFGLFGLVIFNPILLFIALFVYVGAQQEAQQALLRTVVEGIAVREAMMTRFRTLSPDDTLQTVLDELIAGTEHDFPVEENGTVVGMLRRKDIMNALNTKDRATPVGELMDANCFTVDEHEMLDEALTRMRTANCSAVPVVRDDHAVGLLTLENVGEFVMISAALRQTAPARDPESVLTQ